MPRCISVLAFTLLGATVACGNRSAPITTPLPPALAGDAELLIQGRVAGEPLLRVSIPAAGPPGSIGIDTSAVGSYIYPVQANGPTGQLEYLLRLVCPSGKAPTFARNGSVGAGVDRHIMDLYAVRCGEGYDVRVYMDYYHNERELRPIPGFTILPETPARMAEGCPPRLTENADSNAAHLFSFLEVATPAIPQRPFPERISGYGVTGRQQVRFVIDTLGQPDSSSIQAGQITSAATFAAASKLIPTLRFTPAEHHAGCKVPYLYGATLNFGG